MSGTLAEYIPLANSQATLISIPTALIPLNAIIKYVDSTTIAEVSWQLRSGGSGLRPSDYNAGSNNVSWFEV